MATQFPPSSWPYPMTYVNNLTIDTSEAASKAYAVFPGRPYVIRGWLSAGTWSGITVQVYTAEPQANTPFYNEDSMVPIQADAFDANFEQTLVTAGQCLVIEVTGGTTEVLQLAISAITSHE